ncbi:MAG: HupE/UreJ family protein [Rhodospirillales bacterium]
MTRRDLPALTALLLLVPGAAIAHPVAGGLDPFSAGLLHPVLAPNQIMLLLALGLWAGQQGRRHLHRATGLLLAGLLSGGTVAVLDEQATLLPYLPYLALSSVLALLAALNMRLPTLFCAAMALLAGGLAGHETILHARLTGDSTTGIIAAALAVLLICFNAGWLATRAKKFWMQIALRIAAAWLTALSLMMLGLVVLQTP